MEFLCNVATGEQAKALQVGHEVTSQYFTEKMWHNVLDIESHK